MTGLVRFLRATHGKPCRFPLALRLDGCFRTLFVLVFCAMGLVAATAPGAAQLSKNKSSSQAFPKEKGGPFGPKPQIDRTQPLNLQGDQLIYDTKGNRVIARGNVEIFYNNYILTADEVIYDRNANTLTAIGNVTLKDPNGNIIHADRYTLTSDFRDGFAQALSVLAKDETRITGEQAIRREGNTTEFINGRFTPCKSSGGVPPLWCLSAGRIIHDQQAATITYQDATFDIYGFPILYLPYFEHADPTVKRKSGFLLPNVGNSTRFGYFTEVPYYFALAPDYDFTFHPRYTEKQGVLYLGDWRQRLENGEYSIKLAGIDQSKSALRDEGAIGSQVDDLGGWRGSVATKGQFSLSSWWQAGWDVTVESDDEFRRFYGLDSILLTDRVDKVYLQGISDRNYFGVSFYHFGGLLLNDTPQSESQVHPIVDYNYIFADPVLGGELSWTSNLLSFSRDNILDFDRTQNLNRAVSELKWRRRLTDSLGITYTPFAQLRGDVYQENNYVDPQTGQVVSDDTVVRGLATGGVTVAYPWALSTATATHVIEPIGQIITRQASIPQRRLPDEDAQSLVFDDTNLFELDKFSGYDRIETGTRANAGVQYTFQLNDGGYARFLAGESFHLAGENPYDDAGVDPVGNPVFTPRNGLETDRSDYVLGAYVAPNDYIQLASQSRFDNSGLDLQREDLAAHVTVGPVVAQATYSFTAEDPRSFDPSSSQQEIIGSIGLQLTDRWSIGGSMRYDLDDDRRLLDSIQLRYGDECFVLTATYQESFIKDDQLLIEPDRAIMLQFELKHLGQFGYKTDILDHTFSDDQPPQASTSPPPVLGSP